MAETPITSSGKAKLVSPNRPLNQPPNRNPKPASPAPTAASNPTPKSLLIALQKEYSTRFHMFLIVAACISVAVLTTRLMLSAGVTVRSEERRVGKECA